MSRIFICESNIRLSVGGVVRKLFDFIYAMYRYHEDVINVSVINSWFEWKGRSTLFFIDFMKMSVYAGAHSSAIGL